MKIFNFKQTHLHLAVLATCVLVASSSSFVLAAESGEIDTKYYPPASLCYSPEQATFDHSWRMQFNPDGSVENPSKSRQLQIVCPIVTDNTQSRKGMTVTVRYEVESIRSGQKLRCRMAARSLDGDTVYKSSRYQTESKNGKSSFTFFVTRSLPITLLQCTLPSIRNNGIEGEGSRIYSIEAQEKK